MKLIGVGKPDEILCHCGASIEIIAPARVTYKSRALILTNSSFTRKELKFRFPAVCEGIVSHLIWVDIVEFDDKVTIEISECTEDVDSVLGNDWPRALEVEAIKSALEWDHDN